MGNKTNVVDFISKYGTRRLEFIGNNGKAKQYKIIGKEPEYECVIIEFISKSLKHEFSPKMYMEIVSYYIKQPIEITEADGMTTYTIKVEKY